MIARPAGESGKIRDVHLAECVVAEGHQALEVVNAGFKEPGEPWLEHPDVPCRWQVEHAKGTVLAVLFVGPDGDHGEGGTGGGVSRSGATRSSWWFSSGVWCMCCYAHGPLSHLTGVARNGGSRRRTIRTGMTCGRPFRLSARGRDRRVRPLC